MDMPPTVLPPPSNRQHGDIAHVMSTKSFGGRDGAMWLMALCQGGGTQSCAQQVTLQQADQARVDPFNDQQNRHA
jgi:hypothetical protein